jgi:uncharacterized protein (TIGR02284 family)
LNSRFQTTIKQLNKMETEKTIEVLNTLITINNDRIEGYETAAKETEEQDLTILFTQFSKTSYKCLQELKTEVRKLGGEPAEGTLTSGKLHRVWMDLKAALTGKDRKAILNSCEFGDNTAKDTYEKALENDLESLNHEQQTMIKAQHTLLVTDYNKVKTMRDAVTAE